MYSVTWLTASCLGILGEWYLVGKGIGLLCPLCIHVFIIHHGEWALTVPIPGSTLENAYCSPNEGIASRSCSVLVLVKASELKASSQMAENWWKDKQEPKGKTSFWVDPRLFWVVASFREKDRHHPGLRTFILDVLPNVRDIGLGAPSSSTWLLKEPKKPGKGHPASRQNERWARDSESLLPVLVVGQLLARHGLMHFLGLTCL